MSNRTPDSLGMWEATLSLPEQVESACNQELNLNGLPSHDDVENVVILGMGGSGIAGDIAVALGGPLFPVPVSVVKSYETPAFVGSGSLVFAISFSGETEETLSAVEEAYEDGAWVVAITNGGTLAELAKEWEVPLIHVPGSIPQPRAGIGAMTIPVLVVLEQVGLFKGAKDWISESVSNLVKRRDQIDTKADLTKGIAEKLNGTIPLIYGSSGIGSVAVDRWKKQINENVKSPAFGGVYPEVCHNELAGWGLFGDITRQALSLVQLRTEGIHPQLTRRMKWVGEVMRESVSEVIDVEAQGENDLAQLMDLVFLGDIVSLRMANLVQLDPGPIPILNELKNFLKGEV